MFGDARIGEQTHDVVGPSRGRAAGAVAIVLILAVLLVGWRAYDTITDDYAPGLCKTVGWAGSIGGASAPTEALPSSRQGVVDELAASSAAPLGIRPFPVDGWHEHRGRFVRDLPDGYLEVGMTETAQGWSVLFVSSCGR